MPQDDGFIEAETIGLHEVGFEIKMKDDSRLEVNKCKDMYLMSYIHYVYFICSVPGYYEQHCPVAIY